MPRRKEAPWGFVCPYQHYCPHLEGLSTQWVLSEHQRSHIREHEHWLSREEMSEENRDLLRTLRQQEKEIDRLRAENKLLHQQRFKSNSKKQDEPEASKPTETKAGTGKKKRGAPMGHPLWNRKKPVELDRTIEVQGRQSCLAHLIRKADELSKLLESMKHPDPASVSFYRKIGRLFTLACRKKIPPDKPERDNLKKRLLGVLDSICSAPLKYAKAETLRKRLIPGTREYNEVFTFIDFGGPPTNNHAEPALRPLVISRKTSMGTRSAAGSENIGVFASLTQTAKLPDAPIIELFNALLTGTPNQAQAALFPDSS